ncbi:Rz1-like lysis system protein LysC [Escherichia coli]
MTGCAGTQNAPRPAPSVRLIPQTLTIPVTPPPFPDTPTWGNLGIWGDRLLDALEPVTLINGPLNYWNSAGCND